MLQQLAPNLWHCQHHFSVLGMPLSSRMTVLRLADGRLWLHSPVLITPPLQAALVALGEVAFIVAPSKLHHLFAKSAHNAFPAASLFGAPGLAAKRPDLQGLQELGDAVPPEMGTELQMLCMRGIPFGNETVWFHAPSATLILTDLCQWWQGDLSWNAALYGRLSGVRDKLVVPRTVRLMVKDKAAVSAACRQILQWPFERVIVAHNCIIEQDAHAAVAQALACLL